MVKVRIKNSIVIDHNGSILRYGKGAIVDVPDRVYVDNWSLMERLEEIEVKPGKIERLAIDKKIVTPKAKPYSETASVKHKQNASLKKPKQK